MTSSTPDAAREGKVLATWRRPHPGFMVVEMARTLRSLVFPFIVIVLGSGALRDPFSPRTLAMLGMFSVILLGSLLWNLMEWRFFRYALTPSRLLVRSGWIQRQERSVPYQRIQSVDVVETPTYRLLGLARVRVETAAGGMGDASEVDIRAVRRDEATAVRDRLMRERQIARQAAPEVSTVATEGLAAMDAAATEGELVRAMSLRELLLAGATSGTIGPAAAVIGAGLSVVDDIVPETWWERVPWERVGSLWSNLGVIGIFVLIVALLAWLMAIAGTVITYYGFELRRSDEHLFMQRGLLEKRRVTVPIHRIQAIQIEEGILRQPFGFVSMDYTSAGRRGEGESGSGTLFPFLRRRDLQAMLERIAPEFAIDLEAGGLNRLPRRALPRYIIGGTVSALLFGALVIGVLDWWRDDVPWWGYLPLLMVPARILTGWLAYRDAGWTLGDRVLALRARSLARSTMITTRRRIQHRALTANPLQRRAGLVTLHVSVAGGGRTSLMHLDRKDGEQVLFGINPRYGARSRVESPPDATTVPAWGMPSGEGQP
jgi:putative membrane protein